MPQFNKWESFSLSISILENITQVQRVIVTKLSCKFWCFYHDGNWDSGSGQQRTSIPEGDEALWFHKNVHFGLHHDPSHPLHYPIGSSLATSLASASFMRTLRCPQLSTTFCKELKQNDQTTSRSDVGCSVKSLEKELRWCFSELSFSFLEMECQVSLSGQPWTHGIAEGGLQPSIISPLPSQCGVIGTHYRTRFLQCWGSNSWPRVCWASAFPTELQPQPLSQAP